MSVRIGGRIAPGVYVSHTVKSGKKHGKAQPGRPAQKLSGKAKLAVVLWGLPAVTWMEYPHFALTLLAFDVIAYGLYFVIKSHNKSLDRQREAEDTAAADQWNEWLRASKAQREAQNVRPQPRQAPRYASQTRQPEPYRYLRQTKGDVYDWMAR